MTKEELEIAEEILNLRDLGLYDNREYENFIQFTNETIVVNVVDKYLKYIFDKYNINILEFNNKVYTSLYLFINFPNIMDVDDKLRELSKNILNLFTKLEKNDSNINVDNFKELLQRYNKIFTNLVDKNKHKLIEVYAEVYINLEEIEGNVITDIEKETIINSKNEYYRLLKEIVLDDNIAKDIINKKREKIINTGGGMYTDIKKEYWAKVKDDLKENNNEIILGMLNEILNILKSFVSNNVSVMKEIEEQLNLNYVEHIINENSINKNDIYNIFNNLINILKKLQCPDDDEGLDIWIDKIKKSIYEDDNPIYETVGDMFEEYYNRLYNLKKQIINFKV